MCANMSRRPIWPSIPSTCSGVNDNETDVENFVRLCAELKVDFVTPVFSFLDDSYESSEQARRMFKLLVDRLAEEGIFTANVDTLYSGSYHQLYQASFQP